MTKRVISILFFTWLMLRPSLAALQITHVSALPEAPTQTDAKQTSQQPAVQFILLTRMSYCFPDLATNTAPLSVRQKFTLFAASSVSLHAVVGSAAGAGFGQALNSPAGFGQGSAGYGKRFGASMARTASNNFFATFLFASILRQDPRFFVRSSPTFGQAVKYSLTRLVITRRDSGENTWNYSGLLGPLAGEGLANVYLPDEDRTVGYTFSRYGTDLAWRAFGNLLREYWPTLSKRLLRPKPVLSKPVLSN